MALFEKESVEQLTSTEEFDHALKVIGFKGWLVVLFCAVLSAGVILWACFGTIPITVSGQAITFAPEDAIALRSPVSSIVTALHVAEGTNVKEGEVLVTLDKGGDIVAPIDGFVSVIHFIPGESVEENEVIVSMQKTLMGDEMKIFGFIPIIYSQSLKVGMETRCVLNNVDHQKYGILLGKIREIARYPASPNGYYMRRIPSKTLVNYLLNSPVPLTLIIIDPIRDPHTASGLAWTSKKGPPYAIQPAELGTVRVLIEEVKPISYVFPSVKK